MDESQLENSEEPPSCQLNPSVTSLGKPPALNGAVDVVVEVVSDINRAKLLWEKWNKHQSLFDTWDFRYAFWLGYQYKPHFLIIKSKGQEIGLLPLWFEADRAKYAWFGSWWQEDNTLFVSAPEHISSVLAASPQGTNLNAIIPCADYASIGYLFENDLPKYILPLKTLTSSNDFIQNLKKKKRYNVRRDCRIIQEQNPQIIFNNFNDFEELVRLSTERFKEKGEEADWVDPRRVETFRQVIKLGLLNKNYEMRMITVKINNQTAAVDLIAIYNKTYYAIKCGYNVSNFPGIGNFMNVLEIEDALKLKCEKMDFLEIGYGWKDGWFESTPLLKFSKI